jgi:slit protein 2
LWFSKFLLEHSHLAHEAKCFLKSRNAFRDIISLKKTDFEQDCSSQESDDLEDSCSVEFNCPYPCVCENNIIDCKEKSLAELPMPIPATTLEL